MRTRIVAALLLLLLAAAFTARAAPRFAPGQKWAYQTRHGEEASTVTILAVDEDPKRGQIVHIAVDGLAIKTAHGVQRALPHAPISARALAGSVTRLVADKVPLPDFAEAYAHWKAAHGGVFNLPVAKIVDVVEEALASRAR
jgi:hypothetical protein